MIYNFTDFLNFNLHKFNPNDAGFLQYNFWPNAGILIKVLFDYRFSKISGGFVMHSNEAAYSIKIQRSIREIQRLSW